MHFGNGEIETCKIHPYCNTQSNNKIKSEPSNVIDFTLRSIILLRAQPL